MPCFSSASLKQRPTILPPSLADTSPRQHTPSVGQDARQTTCFDCWKMALSQRVGGQRQRFSTSGRWAQSSTSPGTQPSGRPVAVAETGLSLEVAFDDETTLIVLDAGEPHRRAGAGLTVRLRPPIDLTPQDASRHANALNLTEALGASMAHTLWSLVLGYMAASTAMAFHPRVPTLRSERALPDWSGTGLRRLPL